MIDSRNILSDNPVVFLLDFQQAVLEGYRAENTIAGYPSLNGTLKEVKVFKRSAEEVVVPEANAGEEVLVAEYEAAHFMASVQNAILNGFVVDTNSVHFDAIKRAKLVAPKKPVAKVLFDAKPAHVVESPAKQETQEAPRKRGRKAKEDV